MNNKSKQLSNSASTGGAGGHFEAHVQASYVALMLSGGYAPCLPQWPIVEIILQGKNQGFDTDDLIVITENAGSKERCKLLGQIKRSISITQGDDVFADVIKAAWNDFNNPESFLKGNDIIALITGHLSAIDAENVLWLLNQARYTNDVNDFYRRVELANFSPTKSEEKLEAFQKQLNFANNDIVVSKMEVYSFLKHFYILGYDLGDDEGVVLSLLQSHISQFNKQYPQWIWSRIVDVVQTWNQNAGIITIDIIPDDLKEAFKQPIIAHIPTELSNTQSKPLKTDWSQHPFATTLALVNLIGAWDEKNEADIDIIERITAESYSTCVIKAREILQLSGTPFSLQNSLWKIIDRAALWHTLAPRVFDQNLDVFKETVVSILSERDPSFEIPRDERYTAGIQGKVFSYSTSIRKGLVEGLALLGNNASALINCSKGKKEATAILAMREIFKNADWVLWGSLNDLLPTLAEAAPEEYLTAIENALRLEPCPFDELFSQEGDSITGENYMTGLLWSLEILAWDEKLLVRVCVILGELAYLDPGGRWANRPENSLSTILLPWLPQTIATIEKREIAVQTLYKECPSIAWKLIIKLLPNQNQVSSGSMKPV